MYHFSFPETHQGLKRVTVPSALENKLPNIQFVKNHIWKTHEKKITNENCNWHRCQFNWVPQVHIKIQNFCEESRGILYFLPFAELIQTTYTIHFIQCKRVLDVSIVSSTNYDVSDKRHVIVLNLYIKAVRLNSQRGQGGVILFQD